MRRVAEMIERRQNPLRSSAARRVIADAITGVHAEIAAAVARKAPSSPPVLEQRQHHHHHRGEQRQRQQNGVEESGTEVMHATMEKHLFSLPVVLHAWDLLHSADVRRNGHIPLRLDRRSMPTTPRKMIEMAEELETLLVEPASVSRRRRLSRHGAPDEQVGAVVGVAGAGPSSSSSEEGAYRLRRKTKYECHKLLPSAPWPGAWDSKFDAYYPADWKDRAKRLEQRVKKDRLKHESVYPAELAPFAYGLCHARDGLLQAMLHTVTAPIVNAHPSAGACSTPHEALRSLQAIVTRHDAHSMRVIELPIDWAATLEERPAPGHRKRLPLPVRSDGGPWHGVLAQWQQRGIFADGLMRTLPFMPPHPTGILSELIGRWVLTEPMNNLQGSLSSMASDVTVHTLPASMTTNTAQEPRTSWRDSSLASDADREGDDDRNVGSSDGNGCLPPLTEVHLIHWCGAAVAVVPTSISAAAAAAVDDALAAHGLRAHGSARPTSLLPFTMARRLEAPHADLSQHRGPVEWLGFRFALDGGKNVSKLLQKQARADGVWSGRRNMWTKWTRDRRHRAWRTTPRVTVMPHPSAIRDMRKWLQMAMGKFGPLPVERLADYLVRTVEPWHAYYGYGDDVEDLASLEWHVMEKFADAWVWAKYKSGTSTAATRRTEFDMLGHLVRQKVNFKSMRGHTIGVEDAVWREKAEALQQMLRNAEAAAGGADEFTHAVRRDAYMRALEHLQHHPRSRKLWRRRIKQDSKRIKVPPERMPQRPALQVSVQYTPSKRADQQSESSRIHGPGRAD